LAHVSDPFGEIEEELTAPYSGIIVGRAVLPLVNEGDALFHLARVGDVEEAEEAVTLIQDAMDSAEHFPEDEIL
ncbi:MAG: succinylglutamate desuccinylase, partial [Shimia sp.]